MYVGLHGFMFFFVYSFLVLFLPIERKHSKGQMDSDIIVTEKDLSAPV
jgi:hypothetical protein